MSEMSGEQQSELVKWAEVIRQLALTFRFHAAEAPDGDFRDTFALYGLDYGVLQTVQREMPDIFEGSEIPFGILLGIVAVRMGVVE